MGKKPSEVAIFCIYKSSTRIYMINKELSYNGESDDDDIRRSNFESLEVSDLMENEKKTDILDKLETMNEQLKDELKKLKEENDESQKIKKVVYTTEVYFE